MRSSTATTKRGTMIHVLNVNHRELSVGDGLDVITVSSGAAALEAVMTHQFDVALLDVELPDLDGFEICRGLRADPRTANMIVLMISATFVTSKNKVAGLESGADGYLVQPFESAELLATIRSLLRGREAERRAMEVRDEFLAMLGHELRNPIASITTALHLLKEKREPASFDHYLDILRRQATHLSRIVDDLLDVARITRGKVSLERKLVDLRDAVGRCIDSLADDIRTSKHELAVSVPDVPVHVIGDPVRLEQIICNLVTNANKYTPAGGHIAVKLSSVEGRARVEVVDDGIGMAAAMQQRVFDVFVQGSQAIDRSRGGLGLGLTVVRQLVELHDGTVSAYSEGEGKGSRFAIDLPLAPADARVAAPPEEIAAAQGLHIVLIEDNEDARLTLEEALGIFHHEVRSAADGTSGLELVLESRPDVALVDIGLPGLDGYEIARQVHAKMTGAAPRLIAMSGYGRPEDRVRSSEAGFDLHIVKPVMLKHLQQILAEIPRR